MILQTDQEVKFAESRFRKLQDRLKDKYSPTEWKFARLLNRANIYFNRERANITVNTRWCYFDFYIPALNLFIEIDGPEHKLPHKKVIDQDKTRIAESKDFMNFIIRFTNDEVKALDMIDYTVLLKKMSETDKAEGNLRFLAKWLHQQINDYDTMKRNRTKQFGEVMTQPSFMYDREINTIMRFETAFDMHNFTRIRCRYIAERVDPDKMKRYRNGRYAFALDIQTLSKKMDYIWSENIPYDDITLWEVRPLKDVLEHCLELVHSGAIGPYPQKKGKKGP